MNGRRIIYLCFLLLLFFFLKEYYSDNRHEMRIPETISQEEIVLGFKDYLTQHKGEENPGEEFVPVSICFSPSFKGEAGEFFYLIYENKQEDKSLTDKYLIYEAGEEEQGDLKQGLRYKFYERWENVRLPEQKFSTHYLAD